MDTLTQEDWLRVKDVFDRAVNLPLSKRIGLITAEPLPDIARAAALGMLAAADAGKAFLEHPALGLLRDAAPAKVTKGLEQGCRIGDYRIVGVLGRGGAGEVYLAERADGLYEQTVAVKRLRLEAVPQWENFSAERQILARLEHPSIARLIDAGLDVDGRPYTIVEYVQGQGLLEHCASLPLKHRLELFLQICDAVAYAHTRLVIHRDIKPGNVIVTAGGRVKLLDFGVAKLLDPGSFRIDGRMLLAPFTPEYAAPEQIDGRAASTAIDVYALGVVLFELLTGRRPWSVAEVPLALVVERLLHLPAPAASLVAAATSSAPLPARQLIGDIDAIIAKALRKEPQERYATVDALAEDLRRHLRGEPVLARSGARLYVAGRFIKRNRWNIAAGIFALSTLFGAVAGYVAHRQRQADLRLELAQREMRRGNALNDLLTLLLRSADRAAEAAQTHPREVLRTAAERVFQQYQDRPSALAAVVLQLADVFIAVNDTEAAAPMLEQYLEHFGPQADPADLAEVQNQLATVAIRRGDISRAAKLLGQAQAFWNSDPERYRDALLSSRLNQAEIERGQGNVERAVSILRDALAERLQAPGGRETSLAMYQNLASALIGANRFDEAEQTLQQGWAQAQALGQTRTPEAMSLLNSWAVYAANRGQLSEAEQRYSDGVALQRELYGDSVTLASALNGLARALALKGQVEDALPLLEQARDMAARYAGPKSPVVIASLLFEVDAQLLIQHLAAAEAALLRARTTARDQYGPEHVLSLRLDEAEGRLLMAQGHYQAAGQKFSETEAALRKPGASARAFLAQTLISHGALLLLRGYAADALPLLEEASGLRAKLAAPDSWLRAEADGAFGEALLETGQSMRGLPLLRSAERDLQRELGATHPVTQRIHQWLQKS